MTVNGGYIIFPRFAPAQYRVQISFPSFTLPARYQTVSEPGEAEEIVMKRERRFAWAVQRERHDAQRNLTKAVIAILISLALFALHWRIARRREVKEHDEPGVEIA